jgi:hypothetical protein
MVLFRSFPVDVARLFILLGGIVSPAIAQQSTVDMQEVIRDTQKFKNSASGKVFQVVWWVPTDYWQAAVGPNPDFSPALKDELVDAVRPYTIVAVVEGRVGALGAVTFTREEEIRSNTTLVDRNGTRHKPLTDPQVDVQLRAVLAAMQPMFAEAMGTLGKSMFFLVFPGEDKHGKPIAEAKKKGSFAIQLKDSEFLWRLPLGAFMPKKICDGCSEVCSGAWSFCPWCGTSLADAKPVQSRPDAETRAQSTTLPR